jgi:hypothetical protein
MSLFTGFKEYDGKELEDCGKAFVHFLEVHKNTLDAWHNETWPWTELVIDWFADTTPSGLVCDAHRTPPRWSAAWDIHRQNLGLAGNEKRSGGEFMLIDLMHSTYPSYEQSAYWSSDYWTDALKRKDLCVRLALESEWKGKEVNGAYPYLMHSAAKLASIQADAKVLLFGSRGKSDDEPMGCSKVIEKVDALRTRADPSSGWLVLDVPWAAWGEDVKPHAWVAAPGDGKLKKVK